MRNSLQSQVLIPTLIIVLLTIMVMSWMFARSMATERKRQIEARCLAVADLFSRASFPLTDSVVQQLKDLTGAELVVTGQDGEVRVATLPSANLSETLKPFSQPEMIPNRNLSSPEGNLAADGNLATLGRGHNTLDPNSRNLAASSRELQPIELEDKNYFHTVVKVRDGRTASINSLHILYPQNELQRELRSAVWPSVVIGGIASLFLSLLLVAVVARMVRPLKTLRDQVAHIADGRFEQLPLPSRNDEVRDLAMAVNQMALRLNEYEQRIRQTEQVHTLGLLGGGLAHQLRNAATGAKLALEFHQNECPNNADESLEVALRQLSLMERYLKKFLDVAKPNASPHSPVELNRLITDLLPLVEPAARHAHVQLKCRMPGSACCVTGNRDDLEQLLLNLILNAIEAVQSSSPANPEVTITLTTNEFDKHELQVIDNGPGPAPEIADRLFEPLASGKTDGIGLGLSIVRNVTEDHDGEVSWMHLDGKTTFVVELPALPCPESDA
ncbi:MAG: HAMP domain-containing sensor histidine kinase [Pirellulaceae bacterium]